MNKSVAIASFVAVAMSSAAQASLADLRAGAQAANPVAAVGRGDRVASGVVGDVAWEARNLIVGTASTATVAGGGAPRYLATNPRYSGVASLIMNYGAGGSFICTGSLLPDRQTIITAAHCVSDGFGTAGPLTTTAWFNPQAADVVVPTSGTASSVPVTVSQIWVNPGYTGAVIDQNDIALLRLSSAAPVFAQSYKLTNLGNPGGQTFNVAGYGGRSLVGGSTGTGGGNALGTGRLRQGDNRFDYRLGDPQFGGFFTAPGFYGANATNSWVSDFDNGLAANDAACRVAGAFDAGGAKNCNLGVGDMEVSVAGGDSGGPQFINGRIVSVTSYEIGRAHV